MTEYLNDILNTATHEAGHAVIGRVLGLSCGSATIIANEAEGEAGHAIVHDPWKTMSDWERPFQEAFERRAALNGSLCLGDLAGVKLRNARSAFRGTILARMAGAEAENVILGVCQGGDGRDRHEIEMLAESDAEIPEEAWARYEPRMRRQTRRLIRKHRAKIERVAAALLERGELSADEIDALME